MRLLPSLEKSTAWWAATVPWDVVSDEDLSLFYRQTRASFFRLHSSSIVANRSVTSSSVLKWFFGAFRCPLASRKEGSREEAKKEGGKAESETIM